MLLCETLIPGESKRILKHLSKDLPFFLLGRKGGHHILGLENRSFGYQGKYGLFTQLRALKRKGTSTVVIESPLTADGICCSLFASLLGMGIVYQPFAQFSSYLMSKRLFDANPDVRVLENEQATKKLNKDKFSIVIKKLAIRLLRNCFKSSGRGWLTLSKFEEDQIKILFPDSQKLPFVRIPWAIEDTKMKIGNPDFFKAFPISEDKFKFVVWARLDVEVKGIDRLLSGIAYNLDSKEDNYHVFLVGPDYAGGVQKIEKLLKNLNIEDRVTIIGPDRYVAGDHSPLATADASVLLSRWDGFPRSLRESLQLETPVLVSPETHFTDLVSKYGCGESVVSPDDPRSVSEALQSMVEGLKAGKYRSDIIQKALESLQADVLADKMRVEISLLSTHS